MALDKTFYIMAEKEIQERRAANALRLKRRQEEISIKFPKYIQLKNDLAKTGVELVSILSGEGGAKTRTDIEKLSEKNLLIQADIEVLLVSGGYPRSYLNPIYSCEKCKDSGVYNSRRCVCFMDTVRRLASNDLNQKSPIRLSSFSTFDLTLYPEEKDENTGQDIRRIMTHNFQFCKSFAEDFHIPMAGILMYGNTGLGKTHLSLAIANHIIEKGHEVVYGSAPDLLRKIEKEHFGNSDGDTLDLLQNVELLILDDLGAEFESNFYAAALYNLINSRMNSGLPVIINTNLDLQSLQKRYNDRVISRLMTLELLLFCGRDIRILKRAHPGSVSRN